MKYFVEFKPKAVKDLRGLSKQTQGKILEKIQSMENDLAGDVKKLTNFTPEYRLRVGNFRVLFEIEDICIIIYRIMPRDKAYQ